MKKIYIGFNDEVPCIGPLSICLGYFDGIHLGHQELIKKARECGLPVGVITFDKSPLDVIKKISSPLITSVEDREEILEKMDVDYLICLKNDENLLNMSASDFMEKIILPLGSKNAVCGFDFSFGKNKSGDYNFLKKYESSDFHVYKVEEVSFNGKKVSSSLIKELLLKGNIEDADFLLSRPYRMKGLIVRGNQIGRTISFPTINLKLLSDYVLPPNGVYASLVSIKGSKYIGVTNIGVHPSVKELKDVIVESHLDGFSEDVYGEYAEIELYHFMRKEQKFISLNQLKERISLDKKEVIDYFKKNKKFK